MYGDIVWLLVVYINVYIVMILIKEKKKTLTCTALGRASCQRGLGVEEGGGRKDREGEGVCRTGHIAWGRDQIGHSTGLVVHNKDLLCGRASHSPGNKQENFQIRVPQN